MPSDRRAQLPPRPMWGVQRRCNVRVERIEESIHCSHNWTDDVLVHLPAWMIVIAISVRSQMMEPAVDLVDCFSVEDLDLKALHEIAGEVVPGPRDAWRRAKEIMQVASVDKTRFQQSILNQVVLLQRDVGYQEAGLDEH